MKASLGALPLKRRVDELPFVDSSESITPTLGPAVACVRSRGSALESELFPEMSPLGYQFPRWGCGSRNGNTDFANCKIAPPKKYEPRIVDRPAPKCGVTFPPSLLKREDDENQRPSGILCVDPERDRSDGIPLHLARGQFEQNWVIYGCG